MSSQKGGDAQPKAWGVSVDEWAVVAALVLALLVRVGVLTRVPW